ncbi:MAG: putative bifunctional diguanylate cyclase/phosphodiesterase [Henriciella sp.]
MNQFEQSQATINYAPPADESGALTNLVDQVVGVPSAMPEAEQQKRRLLFLICLVATPLLPLITTFPSEAGIAPIGWGGGLVLICISALFLAAIRTAGSVGLIGLIYGCFLVTLLGYSSLLQGVTDNAALMTLALIPMIMGFSSGAKASAIGTLLVLMTYYGVIVSGQMQHGEISQSSVTLIAYSSAVTMISGLLVFYFARLTQNESTELNRDNARIRTMALTDPLTGLWNRRAFQIDMDRLIMQHGNGVNPALLILDLDRFKQINDTHGHDVGDKVLTVFAQRLKAVVGPDSDVYRLGGDEFAIVQTTQTKLTQLDTLGAKIADLNRDPIEARRVNIEFDVSIGIALSDGSMKSIQSLYQQADMAAFVAKEKAGSQYIFFDKMLDGQANRKFEVERALKTAIEHRAINVAFQPQVDLRTGAVVAYEALARWKDASLGSVSPAEFVEIAEETSLVLVLDRLIIAKALRSAGTWLGAHQRVSVNASARSLNSHEFADFVIRQAKRAGLEAHQVEVEITETSLIQNWDRSKSTVEALRAAGLRIVLDDFGVGYSSLSYLVEFPVQKIKFDRSFLLKATDEASVLVMQSIAELANKMSVDLVAEGIETMDQMTLLKSINCNVGQGYLFSRPILSSKMQDYSRKVLNAA